MVNFAQGRLALRSMAHSKFTESELMHAHYVLAQYNFS
jgi:hypothetical protein